jgi:cysteine desulfurase
MAAYLDYAATAPLRPVAAQAWIDAVGAAANPASLHASGRAASHRLEDARERIAALTGAGPQEVVLTSGGTESDIIAITGLYAVRARPRVLVGAGEHKAVLDTVRALPGAQVETVPLDAGGAPDVAALQSMLDDDVALVALMAANNEVGAVTDLTGVAAACTGAGVPWHCDAVQWPGTRALTGLGAPATVALSGHKVGAPVGVGVLLVRTPLPVYSHGGEQEGGIRSGTVNVAGAVAFAAALGQAQAQLHDEAARIAALRQDLRDGILAAVPDAVVNGGPDVLASHLHVTFPGCEGDALLMLLDAAGVEVSTGSACSAGIPQASHVLLAMGLSPAAARGSVRFTLGWASTPADIGTAVAAIGPAVARARRAGVLR